MMALCQSWELRPGVLTHFLCLCLEALLHMMLRKDLYKQIDNLGTFYGMVSAYSSILEWC